MHSKETCEFRLFGRCLSCEAADKEAEAKRKERNRRARMNRQARDSAMRDLGLVKVRGALGGTYWE